MLLSSFSTEVLADVASCLSSHPTLWVFVPLGLYLVYSFFLDPLRKIPGPFLARHFPGWLAIRSFAENSESAILEAHKKYGDFVRIGPKTIMAAGPESVRKVLGYNENYLDKSEDYIALVFHKPSIFSEIKKDVHTVKRRIAAHAYSMQSLTRMEDFVQAHVESFMQRMDEFSSSGKSVDITEWLKFFAFDVIGDLAFGKSFGMLEKGTTDDFVINISEGIEYTFVLFLIPSFLRPLVTRMVLYLPIPQFTKLRKGFAYVKRETRQLVTERWAKRNDNTSSRADILGRLIEAVDPKTGEKLEFDDLATNASTNVVAGSDTITVSLSAVLYHLLHYPEAVNRLEKEVRESGLSDGALFKDISRLPYLDACIKEGMRLTSPFSGPMPRLSPPGGMNIADTFIPEGTLVNVMQCQIHKDKQIFTQPDKFLPERWIEDKTLERYFLGFSLGPRSCIGKNIAILEMKKLLFAIVKRYHLSLVDPEAPFVCRRYFITKPMEPVWIKMERIDDHVV